VTFVPAKANTTPITAIIGAVIDSKMIEAPIVLPEELFTQVIPASHSAIDAVFVNAAAGTTQRDCARTLSGWPHYTW